ncbi:hypothetical protein TraAM80_02300 [Trypanosoma rangeli]|uniref:Uncharacterized protein n=1 Tax=Trypanosoma rangeli TaxID=5698 RepID=A0A422NUW1_TRYRA|nr:uncharacterized protein TraAM80_02300 [Trypanosoma rangeli]RNF09257.1 hypothetical protein TraAM80_02300 [Trypanosoma rangeli]|eukprot:RNF09257.1 hypothetical protein TraAM80_02300 [Trypanosoma rangeli]
MSVWRRWHVDAVPEWRSAVCPYLLRFAHGWPRKAPHAQKSPTKIFPSYWANVAVLSDRERDFFVQCVEYIRYGIEMHPTSSVVCAMNRVADAAVSERVPLNAAAEAATDLICDVVLMPDGRPCMGWFLDEFEFSHYAAVISAMEERWCASSGSLWALKERGITAQLNSMTAWNRQESLFIEAEKWTTERMQSYVFRHVRFAEKNVSCMERSVDRAHLLSLSLLSSTKNVNRELFLPSISSCVASLGERGGNSAMYPTLCRSFGCVLALQPPEFMEFRSHAETFGVALCSIKSDDAICQVYQQLVQDALDVVVYGRVPSPPAPSISTALTNAIRNLLNDLTEVDKTWMWFPRVVTLCLVAPTPYARDEGIRAAVLALSAMENYLDACEAALLQQHVSFDKPSDADAAVSSRGEVGLVDNAVLDGVLCGEAAAPLFSGGDDENDDVTERGPRCPDLSTAWVPGVGLDSSFYVSNILAACDALSGMLGVMESIQYAQTASQRAVHRFRHKLRVHVLRRFGFVNASKMWGSSFSGRALPFLNALCTSLHSGESTAVFRFRNNGKMPHPFDAIAEPSPLLQSLAPKHLAFPGAAPCFCVECGTVQELKVLAAETEKRKSLRCFFAPGASKRGLFLDFVARENVFQDLAAVGMTQIEKAPESPFVDVAAQVEEGRIVARLLKVPHCL